MFNQNSEPYEESKKRRFRNRQKEETSKSEEKNKFEPWARPNRSQKASFKLKYLLDSLQVVREAPAVIAIFNICFFISDPTWARDHFITKYQNFD